jgi:WD40 repeat protein
MSAYLGSDVLSVSVSEDGSSGRALLWNTRERVVRRELQLTRPTGAQRLGIGRAAAPEVSGSLRAQTFCPVLASPATWDRYVFGVNTGLHKSCIKFFTLERDSEVAQVTLGENLTALACSHGGHFLAAGTAQGLGYLWDLHTGVLLAPSAGSGPSSAAANTETGHQSAAAWELQLLAVTTLVFTLDDAFLVTGGEDGSITVWATSELFAGQTHQPWRRFTAVHAGAVVALHLGAAWQLHTARIYSLGRDRTLRILDFPTGMQLANIHLSMQGTSLVVDDVFERAAYVGHITGDVLRIYLPSLSLDSTRTLLIKKPLVNLESDGHSATTSTSWLRGFTERDVPEKRAIRTLALVEDGSILAYGNENGSVGLIHLNSNAVVAEFRGQKAHRSETVYLVTRIPPSDGAVPRWLWQRDVYVNEKKRQWSTGGTRHAPRVAPRFSLESKPYGESFELVDSLATRSTAVAAAAAGAANATNSGETADAAIVPARKHERDRFVAWTSVCMDRLLAQLDQREDI